MTWERASTLPKALIDEFERGNVSREEVITDNCFGVVNHTLVVKSTPTVQDGPPPKKVKAAALPSDPGYTTNFINLMLANVSRYTILLHNIEVELGAYSSYFHH
jgi:hypothetical protein